MDTVLLIVEEDGISKIEQKCRSKFTMLVFQCHSSKILNEFFFTKENSDQLERVHKQ